MMKTVDSKGFTLVELVLVLALLAIVAAVALPKFVSLRQEAQVAKVQSLSGSLSASLALVKAQVAIRGAGTTVQVNGADVVLTGNMPAASADSLRALLQLEVPSSWTRNWQTQPCQGSDFCILGNMFVGKNGYVAVPGHPLQGNGGIDRAAYLWPRGYTLQSQGCYMYYINEVTTNTTYSGAITSGC
ncbi:prepilin-type N-terminal cleavage/methylation domain-containing protein [Shewanella sp. YIC-542]|uniref:prepilin-type N-terminal cleavage/methylation domain-containing protein n=1 Tax=Shewanella mytili TaxID=3377111 RepID=UPI00398F1995